MEKRNLGTGNRIPRQTAIEVKISPNRTLTFKHPFEIGASGMKASATAAKARAREMTPAETREALLEAAAEVFARRGFAPATVREICEHAGANIAAVHYHFGDKKELYREVLRHSMRRARNDYPPNLGLPPNAPANARLRAFVSSLLLRLFDERRHAWHGKLMSREMVEPTGALDELVQSEIRPLFEMLEETVRQILGPAASEELVRRNALSVVGQCTFYHHCQPVLNRVYPKMKLGNESIPPLAEHITAFSLRALQRQAKELAKRRA